MNMMRHEWPLLDKAPPVPEAPGKHLVSAGIVVALHVLLIALILIDLSLTPPPPPPAQPIMIDLVAAAPKQAPRIVVLRVASPAAPVVALPDFSVETPQHAVTVQPPNAGTATAAAAPAAGRESYYARLIAYLDSNKRYPPEARRLHIEGTVRIQFRLDRNGRVLDFAVVGSSGRPILDGEARALIARAQPLPAPPADMPDAALNLVVPVEFRLH